MKKQNVDYYLAAFAEDFYRRRGFDLIDVPWLVKESVGNLTKPDWRRNFWVKDKVLVGSAEQSFIQLFFDGQLKEGKYVATTPCFRDEPRVGWLHQNYFLKTELIEIGVVSKKSLLEVTGVANDFFSLFLKTKVLEKGKNTFDIVDLKTGVELGSYGLSSLSVGGKIMNYVYGTGCALPRLSTVLGSQRKRGYHDDFNIPKAEYGSLEKIFEEVFELRDAVFQKSKLLQLCELADLVGAIDGYLAESKGSNVGDLRQMSQLNSRAFEVGDR